MPPAKAEDFFRDNSDEEEVESYADRSITTATTSRASNLPQARQSSYSNEASTSHGVGGSRGSSVYQDSFSRMDTRGDDSLRGGREESITLEDILGMDPTAEQGETNAKKMIRAWNNEMGAPELLMFPKRLVERFVKDLVARKALLRKRSKVQGQSEDYYVANAIGATEAMRASHILKSFTRLRIHKVEKFAHYYKTEAEAIDPRDEQRMYPNELNHALKYIELTKKYFVTLAMQGMPEKLRASDLNTVEPDLSQAVFFRVRRDCGPVVIPDGSLMHFTQGDSHMCRYSSIQELLLKGHIELI